LECNKTKTTRPIPPTRLNQYVTTRRESLRKALRKAAYEAALEFTPPEGSPGMIVPPTIPALSTSTAALVHKPWISDCNDEIVGMSTIL